MVGSDKELITAEYEMASFIDGPIQNSQNLQNSDGQTFLCASILHTFLVKVFKRETTSFHYFSPRIPNL